MTFPQRGRRYMTETFVPYGREGGEIELVAVFRRDHTELKTRELELAEGMAQLHRSEALKSAIFDHAFAALVSTDAAGRIVEFNPAAEAMFGRSRDEVLGRPVSEVMIPSAFAPPTTPACGACRRAARAGCSASAWRCMRCAPTAASSRWRWCCGAPRPAARVFYTASIADVSERHDAERQIERQREALRQSEKLTAMGSLLAGVAHELNNPLAIVMGRASLLEEKCEDHPELKADAARIREAAERCGRIVRTFLDMARNRPSRRSPVSLNEMARAASEMLLYGYQTHDIELELSLADGLPPVQADADQIGQVVMNLLVNAQQALAGFDGARRVRVETGVAAGERRARGVRLAAGAGQRPGRRRRPARAPVRAVLHHQGRRRGHRPRPRRLALAGARPRRRRRPRAAGGRWRRQLPAEPAAGRRRGAERGAPSSAPESGPPPQARLLVVDDEADLAALMRDMLESAGYDVATAESGAIALELLDTARFDAIVSDLRMPDMDGAGLWREVSARHPALAAADAVRHRRHAVARRAAVPEGLERPVARQAVLEDRPARPGGGAARVSARRRAAQAAQRRLARAFEHGAGDHAVEIDPGGARLGGEGRAEALLEGQDQRRTDGVVVLLADPVAGMPGAERAQHRQQRGRPVEQLQGAADHAHQALALVRHVALEQMAQRRIGAEQVVVEQRGGVARDRLDQGEGAAHEGDLLNVHGRLPEVKARVCERHVATAFRGRGGDVSFVHNLARASAAGVPNRRHAAGGPPVARRRNSRAIHAFAGAAAFSAERRAAGREGAPMIAAPRSDLPMTAAAKTIAPPPGLGLGRTFMLIVSLPLVLGALL